MTNKKYRIFYGRTGENFYSDILKGTMKDASAFRERIIEKAERGGMKVYAGIEKWDLKKKQWKKARLL